MEVDEEPIGYGVLLEEPIAEREWLTIGIREGKRGRGYGKRALLLLTLQAKHSIWLEVSTENDRAINLYKNFGFKEITARDGNLLMVKDIPGRE